MARATFRTITPKLLPIKVFDDAFVKAAREMEKDVKGAFQDAVSSWKHQPVWRGYVRIDSNQIFISVGTTDLVFKFQDEGTKAHFIKPTHARVLHWVDLATGEDRFSMGHEVSGVKPKEISKSIQAIWAGGLMADYFDRHLAQAIQESGHAMR